MDSNEKFNKLQRERKRVSFDPSIHKAPAIEPAPKPRPMTPQDVAFEKEKIKLDFIHDIKSKLEYVNDFPHLGVNFVDISGVLTDPAVFTGAIMALSMLQKQADVVVSPEARGLYFGPTLAAIQSSAFMPVRALGKIPGLGVTAFASTSEYATKILTFKLPEQSFKTAIIVDDVLATGGTIVSIANALRDCGVKVIQAVCLIEIQALKGGELLKKNEIPYQSLVKL